MFKLTDEEYCKLFGKEYDADDTYEWDDPIDQVAQAQLKKVVEVLSLCKSGNEYSITRDCRTQELSMREEDWQQLLKEAGL